MASNTERLLAVALKYYGESEQKGNIFSDDTEIGRKLHEAGQNDGDPWCALLMEVVFCEAFPEAESWLRKNFSANAIKTADNFIATGCKTHAHPQVGDIVIFEKYKNGLPVGDGEYRPGHIGLCIKNHVNNSFLLFEGNTNESGSSEGTTALNKTRRNIRVENGLNIYKIVTIYDRTK